eukprot:13581940-Ditylum_brightwellii.AAC.1
MSSKKEKLNSKGGDGLLDISMENVDEKVDWEVRVLTCFCTIPDSSKDMSSKEEKLNSKED